jgi:hypothetical protein
MTVINLKTSTQPSWNISYTIQTMVEEWWPTYVPLDNDIAIFTITLAQLRLCSYEKSLNIYLFLCDLQNIIRETRS